MPHLKIRGVSRDALMQQSTELVDGLTAIVGCPRDWFTVEHQETKYIVDGRLTDGYAFCEVYWFERDDETKHKVGEYIIGQLKKMHNHGDCCVIFFPMKGSDYCDNGEWY